MKQRALDALTFAIRATCFVPTVCKMLLDALTRGCRSSIQRAEYALCGRVAHKPRRPRTVVMAGVEAWQDPPTKA
jgi:hypothetical protein